MERVFRELHDAYANSASGKKVAWYAWQVLRTQGELLIVNSPCGKF